MKPEKIIVVRHGESEGNISPEKYFTIPDYQICLTENGKLQARDTGCKLKEVVGNGSVQFYVSPFYRTRQTFQEISQAFTPEQFIMREDPRIREQSWGNCKTPKIRAQMVQERASYGTFYYQPDNGESGAVVYDRVHAFIETMRRDFENDDFPQNVVIVTHGFAMRIFMMCWYNWTPEQFMSLENPANCRYVVMEKTGDDIYTALNQLETRELFICQEFD